MVQRNGLVTTEPHKVEVLKEKALRQAMYCIEYERDEYEGAGMWRKAAELDRSKRVIAKMYYGEL